MTAGSLPILKYKPEIDKHLTKILTGYRSAWKSFAWTQDALSRIAKFAVAGKSVRGSLVIYSYLLFRSQSTKELLDAAAALELFHSGFLIHDDIMDRDMIRRGMPTIHSQYEQLAAKDGIEVHHFGISQAINLADLCYFMGYSLLASSSLSVMRLISIELSHVALSQMQDVASGHLAVEFTKEQILSLYRTKTARYTFSLPMMVGATMAGANADIINKLELLGESLGLLYQIRDDELNAMGVSQVIGKSTGSDLTNRKQTLRSVLSAKDISTFIESLRVSALNLIRTLPFSPSKLQELSVLLEFCLTRDH